MKSVNKNMISLFTVMFFMACTSCTDTSVVLAGDYDSLGGGSSTSEDSRWEVKPIAPLSNPDRGYHLECRYFANNLINPFNESELYPKGFLEDCEAI